MTVDELITDLRDIHVPQEAGSSHVHQIDWSPFALLGACVLGFILFERLRHRRWHRHMLDRLRSVGAVPNKTDRWHGLVSLAQEVRLHDRGSQRLPECIHIPGHRASETDFERISAYIRNALRPELWS